MENALLIGLSRQTALARSLNVIANNVANQRTAGYKNEAVIFEEYLMPVARIDDVKGKDRKLSYVVDIALDRDFSQGTMLETRNPFDIAIGGKGWFVIETEQGTRYTRHGEFSKNAQGDFVTQNGQKVLGVDGPINFGDEETDITIARDGTVTSSAGFKGKIQVVEFANERELKKIGENLYTSEQTPTPSVTATVNQGRIEQSNVEPVREIANLIHVTRSYVSVAKMINDTEKLREDAIDRLAQVPQ